MDAKITLSFNANTIIKAKAFADANNISMSRLAEYFFEKITDENFTTLEAYPVADWVLELMQGQVTYNTKEPTNLNSYFESKYTTQSVLNESATKYNTPVKKPKKK